MMKRNKPSPRKKPDESPARSEYSRALDHLTRYLALRDHSQYELKTKLLRAFDPELVERLMVEADENGWLVPEDQIAERLVLAFERRQKSRRYIEDQLKKRHLPIPQARAENEIETVRNLFERKFGVKKLSWEERTKAYRFLKYRGFADRAIREVLKENETGEKA